MYSGSWMHSSSRVGSSYLSEGLGFWTVTSSPREKTSSFSLTGEARTSPFKNVTSELFTWIAWELEVDPVRISGQGESRRLLERTRDVRLLEACMVQC
jgi:hypothetical protein